MNNLIMYNRGSPESFWPQWQAWKTLYPRTTVVSSDANILGLPAAGDHEPGIAFPYQVCG